MRDLQRYADECLRDLRAIGINPPHIESFTVNTRAKSRFGQCRYENGKYSININSDLLDEDCPVMSLRETIFHEIIHTLPKCMNHGAEFQKYAEKINSVYKTNITRASSTKEKYGEVYAKKVAERIKAEGKKRKKSPKKMYELYCPNCDRLVASGVYARQPKWYVNPNRYSCANCRCKLTKEFAYSINYSTYTF